MPFFAHLDEAERYAQSRPYFHPLAIARAREAMGIERSVPLALDVACGTGLSTAALMSIAERAIGIDISRIMLLNAERSEQVRSLQARAESIPLQSGSAPLLSIALAFHWFDQDRFLREAWRVLGGEGLLLVYTNGFTGIMREDAAFEHWSREVYAERFPTPPRDSKPLSAEEAAGYGFAFIGEESYENEVGFTPEEVVAYLTTQTNVADAVEQGRESLESISQWLLEQVRPFFTGSSATFVFVTRAWYLSKKAAR